MLADLAAWLAATSLSQTVQAALWVVPAVQSVHILAIAAVMASAWLMSFRLMGVAGRARTVSDLTGRMTTWIWRALAVLFLTGLVLIVGEPARQLTNWVFLTKMALVVAASLITATVQARIRRNPAYWDRPQGTPVGAKVAGIVLLTLWLAIAVAGRWIAYVEHA